jgi:DNA polymerase-3 subunit gamma/tau
MLSQGAFNALLKTLEEPPEHVKFVLATTDVHKVPETILSRCQRFDFRRLTLQQIADQLGKVAESEGMRLSPAALALLARQAEGGMRDALSLLDQVRAACGDAPADADVAEALGAVDAAAVSRIAGALVARDGAAVLAEIDGLHARGLEMKRVAEELVRHLRNVVVAKLVPASPLDLSDAELEEVRAQAGGADAAQLTRLFDLVQRAVVDVKLSEQPRYALEVALLEGVFLAPGAGVSELLARAEALARGAPLPARAAAPVAPAPSPRPSPPLRGGEGGRGHSTAATPPRTPLSPTGEGQGEGAEPGTSPTPTATAAGDATDRWRGAVAEVEKASPLLAPALKEAALLSLTDGEVVIQLPPGMMADGAERRRPDIEAVFARYFGRPTKLVVRRGTSAPAPSPGAPAAPASIAQTEAAERQARSSAVRETAKNHPNIRDAAKILDGGIDKIDEL